MTKRDEPWFPCPECRGAEVGEAAYCTVCAAWLITALTEMHEHLPPARLECSCIGCVADFAYRLRHCPRNEFPIPQKAMWPTARKLATMAARLMTPPTSGDEIEVAFALVPAAVVAKMARSYHYRRVLVQSTCVCPSGDQPDGHDTLECQAAECSDCGFLDCPNEECGHYCKATGCPACSQRV